MNIIYYACRKSDGVLDNIRLFDNMSKQEQEMFLRELIITSAKAAGYQMKHELVSKTSQAMPTSNH